MESQPQNSEFRYNTESSAHCFMISIIDCQTLEEIAAGETSI